MDAIVLDNTDSGTYRWWVVPSHFMIQEVNLAFIESDVTLLSERNMKAEVDLLQCLQWLALLRRRMKLVYRWLLDRC